ncbi:unnamed protein product [Clonostachys solani]|uniref:Aldehyde dehydrogenase domain-containing protein n=1 Tax=Clonostachys solani TaxID=160281 RepID=A0A9N9ZF81_9HYPO|nr:unnamed protein product [Clonostachys solani]
MPSLARNLSDDAQDKLLACSEDQRARNVRYRQRQLHLLHGFLRQYATKLCELITKESESTDEETWYEFSATLATISKLFHQLDFEDALKREYAISRNQSNTTNRVPHGIVLVRPGNHTIFYSIFAAVATALAAGSSAALRLTPSYTVAIVDRTADLSLAAQALCAARFSFKGKSPYAPDVVIVNEWVLEPFIRACIREIRGDSLIRETDTMPKPGKAQAHGNTTLYSDGAFEIALDASGYVFS